MKPDKPAEPVIDQWRFRGANLRLELLRHDLTAREIKIAEVILQASYGWHQESVIIPELKYFTRLTDITESNVVKVLKGLHRRRVIRMQRTGGHMTYALNPNPENWKALPWATSAEMGETLNLLREVNGLDPIHFNSEPALSFFKEAPDAKKAGAKTVNLTTVKTKIEEMVETENPEFPNLL